jgi:hypothetical protein
VLDGAGDDAVVILRRGDDVEVASKPKERADPLADEEVVVREEHADPPVGRGHGHIP